MAIYDKAHELASAIQKTSEYLEYKKAKETVFSNPELKNKIEEFEKIRYEVQMLTVQAGGNTENPNPEKMQKLQDLYTILVENKEVKEFFDKEVAFNVMLADINKIIAEAVKDVLN